MTRSHPRRAVPHLARRRASPPRRVRRRQCLVARRRLARRRPQAQSPVRLHHGVRRRVRCRHRPQARLHCFPLRPLRRHRRRSRSLLRFLRRRVSHLLLARRRLRSPRLLLRLQRHSHRRPARVRLRSLRKAVRHRRRSRRVIRVFPARSSRPPHHRLLCLFRGRKTRRQVFPHLAPVSRGKTARRHLRLRPWRHRPLRVNRDRLRLIRRAIRKAARRLRVLCSQVLRLRVPLRRRVRASPLR